MYFTTWLPVVAAQGARPQRLLWASTSAKNPVYSDIKYVEPLIGPDTVTTLPHATLEAYREQGCPASRLSAWCEEADRTVDALAALGIDPEATARRLEEDGIRVFGAAYVQSGSPRIAAGFAAGMFVAAALLASLLVFASSHPLALALIEARLAETPTATQALEPAAAEFWMNAARAGTFTPGAAMWAPTR